jgi:hypothetical protein
MTAISACLLALCFDDLEAVESEGVLGIDGTGALQGFSQWDLVDLLVDRFPDVGHPSLRYEVQDLVDRCGGDPIELLRQVVHDLDQLSPHDWNDRFPLDIFAISTRPSPAIDFEVADAHLHSGASIPLELFLSALGSAKSQIDRAALQGRSVRSRSGTAWDLGTILIATRWALRLLRYLAKGESLTDYRALEESGFRHQLVDLAAEGAFWPEVARLAREGIAECEGFEDMLATRFRYQGLCSVSEVFWYATERSAEEFPGGRAFLIGLLRACCALAGVVRARPGDGLSRFVDRFRLMGLTRDVAVGELKQKAARSTLDRIAASRRVVGAEFRKTVKASSAKEFKLEVLDALEDHHRAFAEFVDDHGRAMALSMPVGFRRQPCSGRGGDWTDLDQLREAIHGYNALRMIRRQKDGEALMGAITTIDVAGDEYGSASWPFVAAAELLRRDGSPLGYAIHAGEAFYSALNGVRRVGELFLADRRPDRIGHALALSDDAATRVCLGSASPPIRIGDAICDICWVLAVGGCDTIRAGRLLHDLVCGAGGNAYDWQVWVEAYRRLFRLDALFDHGMLVERDGVISVADSETLRLCALSGDAVDRALAALAWGFSGPDERLPDVTALVAEPFLEDLQRFDAETAPKAREMVRATLRGNDDGVKTAIESCPTSNVRLAGLGDLNRHPLWRWKEEGLEVVIGSDDPIIFGMTISDEFEEMASLRRSTGSSDDLVRRIAADTVASCSGGLVRDLDDLHAVAHRRTRA